MNRGSSGVRDCLWGGDLVVSVLFCLGVLE